MKAFFKKIFHHTLIRYFLSYLFIIVVLSTSFIMIIKHHLSAQFYEHQRNQLKVQMNNLAQQLNEDVNYLFQVNTSLKSNVDILLPIYRKEEWFNYQIFTELKKYDEASVLINSIIIKKSTSETVLSSGIAVTEANGVYQFYNNTQPSLQFDITPYLDNRLNQLICLSDQTYSMLIYLPAVSASNPFTIFYVLDTAEIRQTLSNFISSETLAIALIDSDHQIAAGVNEHLISPYLQDFKTENGFYELNSSESLCIQTDIGNTFSLVAVLSNDSVLNQINTAMWKYYRFFLPLSMVCFVLILFALKLTWSPLHKLTKKIAPENDFNQNLIEQLDQTFAKSRKENTELLHKLDNYRQSIHKALFNSSIGSDTVDVDQFFEIKAGDEIYAIRIHSDKNPLPCEEILQYFLHLFPGENPCILLEKDSCNAVYLLNYTGQEPNKTDVLVDMLTDYLSGNGYFAAISNGSNSPLDIPTLCENARAAANYWDDSHMITNYSALDPGASSLTYPNDKLGELSAHLAAKNFIIAREVLADLFSVIDSPSLKQSELPDFYFRCILVDILTGIGKSMEEANIKFKDYSDLYFATLYSCRSLDYTQEMQTIWDNFSKLLDFYEQSFPSKIVDPDYLREMLNTSFCQPDISISVLAEHFHVSIAYMSYLIKKELGMNFVDYLWELRMTYAQELLKTTDLSVDEISLKVGYQNPSSFRRKFKQATGITPSSYRTNSTDVSVS